MKKRLKTPQKLYLNHDNELPNVDVVAKMLPEVQIAAPRIKTEAEKELEELKDPFAMPSFEDYFNAFMESRGIMTPWGFGKTINPLKRQVNAIKYGLPMYDDGTDDTIAYTQKPANTEWHSNWLNNRKKQLQQNLNSAGIDRTVEEEIGRQLSTLRDVTEVYPSKRIPASMSVEGVTRSIYHPVTGQRIPYEIDYTTPSPSAETEAHERTHGLDAKPQEDVLDVLDQSLRPEWDTQPNSYRNDPQEKYAHLMEARKALNLDPAYIVTAEDVRRWRDAGTDTPYYSALDFFSTLDDASLARIFNEIASTNISNSDLIRADVGWMPKRMLKPVKHK